MGNVDTIDTEELLEGYNRIKKCNFKSWKQLLEFLYKKEKSVYRVGDIMGTSNIYIRTQLLKLNIPITKRNKGIYELFLKEIPDNLFMDLPHKEIARICNCSRHYVGNMKTKRKKDLKEKAENVFKM